MINMVAWNYMTKQMYVRIKTERRKGCKQGDIKKKMKDVRKIKRDVK